MASKYDSYWRAQARTLSRLIAAAASGAHADLDVAALHALGDRESLYGVARVRGGTVLAASNAHAVSLGNVVAHLGLCESYPTQVISFSINRTGRLRVEILGQPTVQLPATALVDLVPVEENNVERMSVEPPREEYEAERRESALVQTLKDYLEREGHIVRRLRIQPSGEANPMFCDVYVQDLDLLVEAKGSVDRQSIRMAIGQLIDYRRFKNKTTRCALLLPSRPRADLLALIDAAGVELICVRGDSVEWPSRVERARSGGRDQ